MRVLISSTTYHPALNGQAIFVVSLAEGLAARGHTVSVIYPDVVSAHRTAHGVELETVRSISLSAIHGESFFPLFPARRIRDVVQSFQPEIIHIHDHYPISAELVRLARQTYVPIVATNHFAPANLEPYIPFSGLLRGPIERLLWSWMLGVYRHADYVTTPSALALETLRQQKLALPGEAIFCGADLGLFRREAGQNREETRRRYGISPGVPVFGYVGRLDREKRVDVLLQALSQAQHADIELVVAGDGAELPDLLARAETLNVKDRVHFVGRVPNRELPNLLNCIDVFAMASEAELLSIATLEAMACSLPLLLSRTFVPPELYTHGVNCYLFETGNTAEAAGLMDRLVNERDRWPEMAQKSLERAEKHSLSESLDRYSNLYARVLEGRVVEPMSHEQYRRATPEAPRRIGPR